MPETTGPVAAQHRAGEAAVQATYRAFIGHTVDCAECRGGMDCATAADLRRKYRAAKSAALAS